MQGEGELEVPEVAGGELHLEAAAVAHDAARCGDGGVVDEDVERAAGGVPVVGELLDRGWVEQVHATHLSPVDPGEVRCGAVGVAGGHGDGRAGSRQGVGCGQADAGVPAGDDRVDAGEVDVGQDVVGRRRGGEAGAERVLLVVHSDVPPGR